MSKTKVYIASRFIRRDEAAIVAQRLRDTGQFVIVSTWHDGPKDDDWEDEPSEEDLRRVSERDAAEVVQASILINLSDKPGGFYQYGSRHVEFGMAYALGKQCVIIGPLELMFHRLPGVIHFEKLTKFLEAFDVV